MNYISLSANDSSCTSIVNLQSCLSDLYYCKTVWLSTLIKHTPPFFLVPGSELIVTRTSQQSKSPTSVLHSRIRSKLLELLLTVTLPWIGRSAFYHIRAVGHIRPSIADDGAKTIACSFVTSRIDYVNSALYGISEKNIHRLQRMQNTLARVVLGSRRLSSVTLPICYVTCTGYLLNTVLNLSLQN